MSLTLIFFVKVDRGLMAIGTVRYLGLNFIDDSGITTYIRPLTN